jgi:uncharacterized protein with ACT and thioredoxin-like domain
LKSYEIALGSWQADVQGVPAVKRRSLVSALVLAASLVGGVPAFAAKTPKPKHRIGFVQVVAPKSCGVYYRYTC